MEKNYRIFVLSNTHWDREWYMPHEKYLVRLVGLVDRLLEIMEREKNYIFISDGQFSMIDDYLKVRPENTERVKKLVSEGRLEVGPWYTQPLETLVSGEALIRNLHYGIKGAETLGRAMRVSYEIDQFGHASQMPQILRGFDIASAVAWRGVPSGSRSAFKWTSPDGTSVMMLYSNWGYGEATALPKSRADFTEVIDGKEYERSGLDSRVKSLVENRALFSDTDCLMWLNGIDHSFAQPDVLEVIQLINEAFPELKVKQCTAEEYSEAVENAYADGGHEMKEVQGELMYTAEQILESTHSCHPRQKLAHYRTERYLERCLEPTDALSWLAGFSDCRWALDRAWSYVLENHAHDTLGCTSVDEVFREAMCRYEKAYSLAEQCAEDARRKIMACYDAFPSLFVFNTSSFDINGVREFVLDIPEGFGGENIALKDGDGGILPLRVLSSKKIRDIRYNPRTGHPTSSEAVQIRALVDLPDVPAFGWRRFDVIKDGAPRFMQNRTMHYLSAAPGIMENEYLRCAINPNGTVDITDKPTGYTYKSQFTFEDTGEDGNVYIHIPPFSGSAVYSICSGAKVSLKYDTPLGCAYEIALTLSVPEGKGKDGFRSEHEARLDILLTLSLKAGARRLEAQIKVVNRARDHRLRVLFPTYITDAEKSRGGQPFDFPERNIHEPEITPNVNEQPYPTHPMQDICDITGSDRGLTVAAAGIYEYECTDDAARALALSLVRANNCIDDSFGTSDQYDLKEAENLCEMTFNIALLPHGPDWTEAYPDAIGYLARPAIALGREEEISTLTDYVKPARRLPDIASALKLTGKGLVITSLKKAYDRDSLIVRILNMGEKASAGSLEFTYPDTAFDRIYEINLDERRQNSYNHKNGKIDFNLRPKGLMAFEFEISKRGK